VIPLTCALRVSTIGSQGIDHFRFRGKFTFGRRSL
jgi:hypothetical protein